MSRKSPKAKCQDTLLFAVASMANMAFAEGYYADVKLRNAILTSLERIIASLLSHVKKKSA